MDTITAPQISNYVYLKITKDNTVAVFGDETSLNKPVSEGGGDGTYDLKISLDEWVANGYMARVIDNKIFLGKTQSELLEDQKNTILIQISTLKYEYASKIGNTPTTYQKDMYEKYSNELDELTKQNEFPWGGDITKVSWPKKPSLTPDTLEDAKKYKLLELNPAMEKVKESSDTYIESTTGYKINANTTSKINVDSLITSMSSTGTNVINFMTYDNVLVNITLEQLKTIQLELIQYGNNLYARKWSLRNKINACTTIDEVNSIDITFEGITI